VGGTGAKLMQTLIHLSAAGLLPDPGGEMKAVLVDPDEANGTVDDCKKLSAAYEKCQALNTGKCDLFKGRVPKITEPWTPVHNAQFSSMNDIFQYTEMKTRQSLDADLMELLFVPDERKMTIEKGFMGRPAIGATILADAVDFTKDGDPWSKLSIDVKAAAASKAVHVMLAGSVFGGSGAAGVPTIVRLVEREFREHLANLRIGLILFLPYFQFEPVKDAPIQADPHAFSTATAEALKYYDERGFLDRCESIYAVGEETPAMMPVAAVGAAAQRNEPHFLELIAGLGAIRFFGGQSDKAKEHTVSLAARKEEGVLEWDDLATEGALKQPQMKKLRQMALFAVAYRYIYYPVIETELAKSGESNMPFLRNHIFRQNITKQAAQRQLYDVSEYVNWFLTWLLRISTPRRGGFTSKVVKHTVFALEEENKWRLKTPGKAAREFHDSELSGLFWGKPAPDYRTVAAGASRSVDDAAVGCGRILRAIYDSCELD
jgi:hypothetical protein